jgi:sugar phosphate isomerase/epimerase
MRLLLHGYSFRRYPLEHLLAVAADGGWDGIELVHFHFDPEDVEREVDRIALLARGYGVRIGCIGYDGRFTDDDPQAREHSIRLAERAVETAGRHGIGLVNGWAGALVADPADWRANGSAAAEAVHFARAAEAYRRLGDLAARHGVSVGVETHPAAVHDTVATAAKLLADIPSRHVVATPDPGNTYVFGGMERDPEVLDALAGRIGYFHMKNCLPTAGGVADFTVDTAAGAIDNVAWFTKLLKLDALETVAVEYCGEGDPHPVIAAAPAYARRCRQLAQRLAA